MGSAESKPSQGISHQQQSSGCPVPHQNRSAALNPSQSCPSPKNQMPTDLAQKPLPGQAVPLETNRVVSSIPMVDESGEPKNWIYPSQQMFFDAMRRKNWNPNEVDMKTVVPIHNAVNERAWAQILEWERDTGSSKYLFIISELTLDVVVRN
jgi:cytochrome c heme-lyase